MSPDFKMKNRDIDYLCIKNIFNLFSKETKSNALNTLAAINPRREKAPVKSNLTSEKEIFDLKTGITVMTLEID